MVFIRNTLEFRQLLGKYCVVSSSILFGHEDLSVVNWNREFKCKCHLLNGDLSVPFVKSTLLYILTVDEWN